jgi:UPF0755 protein
VARALKLLGVALLAVVAAGMYGAWRGEQALIANLVVSEPNATLNVPRGTHLGALVESLESRGVLKDGWALRWYARYTKQAGRIQAGEYILKATDTPLTLLERMVRGQTVRYTVTLVEGMTFREIRAALANASPLASSIAELTDEEVMARLGMAEQHPEGWFLPDTYQYARGYTDLDLLRRAHKAMTAYLETAWTQRAQPLPYETAYDALIMASIVEKETGRPDERAQVAGVFVRRLTKGMKLQTDPTVIYGMGERYDGNIRRADLREDTPYNTYVHKGLTPTPIANPGRAALNAALHPASGTALYFVARGDGSGGHTFTDTYAQHKVAVGQYLKALKQRKKAGS